MTNVTVSGNTALGDGGGIRQAGAGALTLTNVTVSGNASAALGGGLRQGRPGAVTIRNTILAGNTVGVFGDGPDCSGTLASLGHNLIQDTSGCRLPAADTVDVTFVP